MNKAQKDKEFFEEIYNTTFTGLRKFVSYRCTNSALVDDILQEVYIEVFRHSDLLREHENIVGWVYKTADNKTKKLNEVYYKYYNNKTSIEEWNLTYEENALTEIIQSSEYQSILNEDEFLLLMMKYKEGYSHQEIAQIRNITYMINEEDSNKNLKYNLEQLLEKEIEKSPNEISAEKIDSIVSLLSQFDGKKEGEDIEKEILAKKYLQKYIGKSKTERKYGIFISVKAACILLAVVMTLGFGNYLSVKATNRGILKYLFIFRKKRKQIQ